MTSLVCGGTGIVGSYIVDQLVRVGDRPMVLSRRRYNRTVDLEWFQGDLTSPEALILPPFKTLYCTAPVGLLAKALPCMVEASGGSLCRVIAFTSTSIITKANSEIATERESVRLWAEAEQQLIAGCERHGVEWTVLRPTIIYDEGRDANITRLARLIERIGFMPLAGSGSGLRQPVHAEDLAIGAIAAAASSAAANKIYVVTGSDAISYREMVGRIFDGLCRPRRVVAVPPFLWRTAFTLVAPFISNANVAMGSRMASDMIFDSAIATKDFGWNSRPFRPQFNLVKPRRPYEE